ncbi:WD40 REPEAT FAMILY [Salix koriyanagi]|uniref:WD40 REPEAT FAMILY n=1 Tax=Salix koriyanagi TaxID=2511006 RepID=A0A9Q0PY88_9ROSI|nr:WD40 REPEAT FAMILY [Salix koriyanagi]
MAWQGVFSANGLKNDVVPLMGLVTINGLGWYDSDDDATIRIVQSDFSVKLLCRRDKVVDFQWNASDPWTVVSVSDDDESTGGGGTLQIWRMIDMIHRDEEDVLAELENFKSHILACERS